MSMSLIYRFICPCSYFDEKVNLMESKDPQRILHLSLYYGHCDPGVDPVVYLIGNSSERRKKLL